jgi:hypothetical protein
MDGAVAERRDGAGPVLRLPGRPCPTLSPLRIRMIYRFLLVPGAGGGPRRPPGEAHRTPPGIAASARWPRQVRRPPRLRIPVIYRSLQLPEALCPLPRPPAAGRTLPAPGPGPRHCHRPHRPWIRMICWFLQPPRVAGSPRRPRQAADRATPASGRGPRRFHRPRRPRIRMIYWFLQSALVSGWPRRQRRAADRAAPAQGSGTWRSHRPSHLQIRAICRFLLAPAAARSLRDRAEALARPRAPRAASGSSENHPAPRGCPGPPPASARRRTFPSRQRLRPPPRRRGMRSAAARTAPAAPWPAAPDDRSRCATPPLCRRGPSGEARPPTRRLWRRAPPPPPACSCCASRADGRRDCRCGQAESGRRRCVRFRAWGLPGPGVE